MEIARPEREQAVSRTFFIYAGKQIFAVLSSRKLIRSRSQIGPLHFWVVEQVSRVAFQYQSAIF